MEREEEIRRVLYNFDLGKLQDACQIERGFVNQNWIIETTQGRYFLKRRHPDLRNPDIILAQHALIKHLRHLGFPVPEILSTATGETLLVLDGEFYEIHEFIEGTSYQYNNLVHFQEAAVTLGHYHTCVHDFEPLALQDLGSLYDPAILTANLNGIKDSWGLERDSSLQQIIREIESHASDLTALFVGHNVLPYLVIHGDYHAGNLIFEGDRIVGVVDYDKASWQPRVVELAEALIYFTSTRPSHLKHLVYDGFLEWEKFAGFMRHYAMGLGYVREPMQGGVPPQIDPENRRTVAAEDIILQENEVRALPNYIRCIWLSNSLQGLRQKVCCPSEAPEALMEVLALGNWSAAHRQRMIETVRRTIGTTSNI